MTTDREHLLSELNEIADPHEVANVQRFYGGSDAATKFMGVSIGKIFPIAKRYTNLSLKDVDALLEDDHYEIRMAAVAILDFKARQKRTSPSERKRLYDFYVRRHDRIDNWGLVDRAAPQVLGEYLLEKDRGILDELAKSNDPNRRRSALVCTHAFIKRGQTADTFRVAQQLASDDDKYVQKAIASWVREAGKQDQNGLISFLEENRSILPRTTITAASKLLPEKTRNLLKKRTQED